VAVGLEDVDVHAEERLGRSVRNLCYDEYLCGDYRDKYEGEKDKLIKRLVKLYSDKLWTYGNPTKSLHTKPKSNRRLRFMDGDKVKLLESKKKA
jgi:hypothetical protein